MGDLDTYLKFTKHDIVAKFCAFISHKIIVGMGTSKPVPVAALSKVWVCDRPPAGIVGSKPTGGMDVCLL